MQLKHRIRLGTIPIEFRIVVGPAEGRRKGVGDGVYKRSFNLHLWCLILYKKRAEANTTKY